MLRFELSIIIVSYNTKNKIADCLESVLREITDLKAEVIVIDNASTDNSGQVIEKFKQVKFIQNKRNVGFAKACNQGATLAQGKYLFFLNPDTKVTTKSITSLILEVESRKDAAVIAPKLVYPDGSDQNSVRNFPTIQRAIEEFFFFKKGVFEGFSPKVSKPQEVEAVVGAAMVIPKVIFKKLGGFDERYFMYYEDLDFCRKARKAGYKIIFMPQAKVIHEVGISGKGDETKTLKYLKDSSRIYHGSLVSFLINLVLFWGQKWQKLFANSQV